VSFVFLLAMNNSGTTVASQALATYFDWYLPPTRNNEGQNLPEVADLIDKKNRWDPQKVLDWPAIASRWELILEKSGKEIFLEASPPNIVRFNTIKECFKDSARYIIFTSDPMLQIPSVIYNYEHPPLTEEKIVRAVNQYVKKLSLLHEIGENNPAIPRTSYELLCSDLDTFLGGVGFGRSTRSVGGAGSVMGKRNTRDKGLLKPKKEIVNLMSRSAHFLVQDERDIISELLKRHESLLNTFGYSSEVQVEGQSEGPFSLEGALRRKKWEQLDNH